MDDVDPTLLILLAVVALFVLKPDLLSSLLGGRSAATTPAAPPGPNVTLYQPPPATSVRAWQASGHGDGSGRDPANPAMPVGWKAGDPAWHSTTQATADARDSAYAAAHPCPSGQFWNSLSFQCTPLVDLSQPGQSWYGAPPPGETPSLRSTPSAPAAVAEIKASNRRQALFTPWSGS
jgi:hypothetical protein